jgi:nucleoside phosphorylase
MEPLKRQFAGSVPTDTVKKAGMILMVAAESIEFDGLRKHLDARVVDWGLQFSAFSSTQDWAIVANGPGRSLARAAVSIACGRQIPVTAVVSIGFCGGLDSSLAVGDIVIANQVIELASGLTFSARPIGQAPTATVGAIVCSDRVAVTVSEKVHLRQTGAIAVEMEASGVAAEAERRGLPFHCARVISDTAKEDMPLDFNRYRSADGRFNRAAVARAALLRPFTRIPGLLALQRNCRIASAQMGDFLAKCQF